MATIDLSPEEIGIIREALDSAEYWEHQDVLPHDSGYILGPQGRESAEMREARREIRRLRAIDKRLAAILPRVHGVQ